MSLSRLALAFGLISWSPVHGQKVYVEPPHVRGATGTVYGYVLCGDTGRPARMASVTLQPVVAASTVNEQASTTVVQALMDGSFTIPDVTPGDYYVIAELDGYVSALSLFSRADLSHPPESMMRMLSSLVRTVRVSVETSSRADVTLVRGGSISGTVRFEDGMPDAHSRVVLLRESPGRGVRKYDPITLNSIEFHTDDQGHFRFAGLPEGEYTLFAVLSVQNRTDFSNSQANGSFPTSTSTLSVYYGDTFRISPKRITLKGTEDSVDNIEIRLSKLHSVSGTVVDATTGTQVSSGTVTIVWPKDGDFASDVQVTKTDIDGDGSFHFAFIPEGEFELKATNVRKTKTELEHGPSGLVDLNVLLRYTVALQGSEQKYGDAQVPLIVQSDMTGVTVSVSPKAATATNQ